jgi:hypothetical protein
VAGFCVFGDFSMRRLLLAATALIALSAAPAPAATIDLFAVTPSTSTLILAPVVPGGNQPLNNPCLICGTNQPQQPTGFGYNNFDAGGNDNEYLMFSTATVGGSLNQDQLGTGYQVGDGSILRAFLLAQASGTTFSVGIDVNDTNKAQTLESFYFLNLTDRTVLASFSPGPGGVEILAPNNGSGFPDYTLTGFNIDRGDISLGDEIIFFARWSGANDGAESFFLVPTPTAAVPELSTWAMMILGFAGVGLFGMRKRNQDGPASASFSLAPLARHHALMGLFHGCSMPRRFSHRLHRSMGEGPMAW